MILYILNTILFSAAFWLIYQLLLKKETFFTANRVYLLAAPVVALVLPLLSFEFFQFGSAEGFVFHLPVAELGELTQTTPANPSSETAQTATHSFSLIQILIGVYSLGVLVALGLFLRKIRRLQKLKNTGKIFYREDVDVISLPISSVAFSFFNSIFLGENHSEEEKGQILAHEKVHVREKHSWDLLYFEVLRILLWFNPFVYLFQKNTAEVHEFLADRKVTKTTSKKTYAQSLLNAGFGTRKLSFTNSFFTENSLKTRLLMLYKKSSTRSSKLKFLVVVPLVFLMLTYVACSEDETLDAQNPENSTNLNPPAPPSPPTPEDFEVDQMPFRAIDKSPEFTNGFKFKAKGSGKQSFSKSIQKFVNENFDRKKTESPDIKGRNSIYVQFKIGKDGKVHDVRAKTPHVELKQEAKRVIKALPQMKPGENDGKPVTVVYTLPIVFQVN